MEAGVRLKGANWSRLRLRLPKATLISSTAPRRSICCNVISHPVRRADALCSGWGAGSGKTYSFYGLDRHLGRSLWVVVEEWTEIRAICCRRMMGELRRWWSSSPRPKLVYNQVRHSIVTKTVLFFPYQNPIYSVSILYILNIEILNQG